MNSEKRVVRDCNSMWDAGQNIQRGSKYGKKEKLWCKIETTRPEIFFATEADPTYPNHTALILQLQYVSDQGGMLPITHFAFGDTFSVMTLWCLYVCGI